MVRQISTKGQGKQRFKFIGETIAELRKVVWPTRQEATYLTSIVISVTIVVAIFLWIVDEQIFARLMEVILIN